MISVELPIVEEKIIEGKLVKENKSLKVEIDTSIYSQTRWEANFPEQAKNEGLFDYIERIKEYKNIDVPKTISLLKAVYCFIETDITFKNFLKLFKLSETSMPFIEKLKEAFNLILQSSAEKN